MHKITDVKQLSESVYEMTFEAPDICRERKAGQFIIIQLDTEYGERIPLTIADFDNDKGTITIVYHAVGSSTKRLAEKKVGDYLENVLGPLGQPTDVRKYGKVVCVGGGIGVAPLFPIIRALKDAGNEVTSIIGARTKDLVIMEDKIRAYSDEVIVCTDDGSYGRKALVTEPLKEICETDKPDMVVAIGPAIMMKFCVETTRPYGIYTVVSLNSIMVDGTGMCGGCRVSIGGETKFVCVDGPEFDGHKVDFDNLMSRNRAYTEQETTASHGCRIGLSKDK